ncbi:hypothetical protein BS78_10G009400, partial [Paspalum vaginatum]
VIPLLGSFPDLLAFAATCHSWRSAFSSYPSKSSLNTFVPKCPCYVTDLASQDTLICSQIPLLSNGASFGHMIISNNRSCVVSDVFTGIDVSSPLLPVEKHYSADIYFDAALTAPLSSPNSHLIVSTGSHNFFWRVGSNSWSKHSSLNGPLTKFVDFKGQTVKIPVRWGGRNSMKKWHIRTLWLVACGEMLLMVGPQSSFPGTGDVFEAYRLDTSTEPAEWVKVDKLEDWAIFISKDERVQQPLSCMNPERKGRWRSNCYGYDRCVVFELGKPKPCVYSFTMCCSRMMQPMWVVPSMFSCCCEG